MSGTPELPANINAPTPFGGAGVPPPVGAVYVTPKKAAAASILAFSHDPIVPYNDYLVTIVTATRADGSTYWRQAFFMSVAATEGTWFPIATVEADGRLRNPGPGEVNLTLEPESSDLFQFGARLAGYLEKGLKERYVLQSFMDAADYLAMADLTKVAEPVTDVSAFIRGTVNFTPAAMEGGRRRRRHRKQRRGTRRQVVSANRRSRRRARTA